VIRQCPDQDQHVQPKQSNLTSADQSRYRVIAPGLKTDCPLAPGRHPFCTCSHLNSSPSLKPTGGMFPSSPIHKTAPTIHQTKPRTFPCMGIRSPRSFSTGSSPSDKPSWCCICTNWRRPVPDPSCGPLRHIPACPFGAYGDLLSLYVKFCCQGRKARPEGRSVQIKLLSSF
jgi:hypothetical protein